MLRGYFDKSGHHGDRDELIQFTLGGCIASVDAWETFESDWTSFLRQQSIGWFHATDFADLAKHEATLEAASKIIWKNGFFCYGSTTFIPQQHRPTKPKTLFQQFYEYGALDVIWNAAQCAKALDQKIDLIFARHKDFSIKRIQEHFAKFQAADPSLSAVSIAEPQDCAPLQAADFVAYEVQRYHRSEILNEAPLRRQRPLLKAIGAMEWRMTPPALPRRFYLDFPLTDNVSTSG